MLCRAIFTINLLAPAVALAQDSATISERTWTASLQAGFTSTFQMALGGIFGAGPDVQAPEEEDQAEGHGKPDAEVQEH